MKGEVCATCRPEDSKTAQYMPGRGRGLRGGRGRGDGGGGDGDGDGDGDCHDDTTSITQHDLPVSVPLG